MEVSVAMATYNGMPYIQDQLRSIKEQTRQPDELIICDDCSTDETVKMCEEFSEQVGFTVVINQNEKNHGYSKNFEKALSLCTKDIVFICDQDDYWNKNKIETIVNAFSDNAKTQIIIHDIDYCDESLKPIGQTKLSRINSYTSPNNYITGMASAIRKPFLDLCLPIPNTPVLQYDSWLHACANMINLKTVIPESLAFYRRHSSNVTGDRLLNVAQVTNSSHFKALQLQNKVLKSPVTFLTNTIIVSSHKKNWLIRNSKELVSSCLIDESFLNKLTEKLSHDISVAESRLRICRKPFVKRLIPAFSFFVQGNYREFSGFKSLLKDVFYSHG